MLRLSSSRPRNGLQGRTVATTASIDPTAPVYEPHWTLREARDRHFAIGGFCEEQYAARFVRFRFGTRSVWLPKSPGRTRALPYHDLHHVLTAYPTSWRGEVEIAAWELASGCRDYLTGWVINLGALAIGLVLAPTPACRAFVRGRHSDNLYGAVIAPLLGSHVGDIRAQLRLDGGTPRARWHDAALFVATAVVGVTLVMSPVLVAAGLLALL